MVHILVEATFGNMAQTETTYLCHVDQGCQVKYSMHISCYRHYCFRDCGMHMWRANMHRQGIDIYPAGYLLIWQPSNWYGALAPLQIYPPLSPSDHLVEKAPPPLLNLGSTFMDPQIH